MTNPYDPPQSDLRTSKPRVVYVNKFNGKLAFWSGLAIALVLLVLFMPSIETDRHPPRTLVEEIVGILMIITVSAMIGLYLGFVSGTPLPEKSSENNPEELDLDEPKI